MLRTICILGLLTLVLFGGVKLWYGRVVKGLKAPEVIAQNEKIARHASSLRSSTETGVDYQIILDRNIFDATLVVAGETKPQPGAKVEPEPESLQETTLQLVLLGTVAGSTRDARAIIVDKKENRQEIYQIGDAIQGAYVTAVDRGQVVLEVNGRNEVLTIKDREGGGPGAPGFSFGPGPPIEEASPAPQVNPAPRQDVPVPHPRRRVNFRQEVPEEQNVNDGVQDQGLLHEEESGEHGEFAQEIEVQP